MPRLISPYGGELVNLLVPHEESEALKEKAARLPSLQLSERCVCDLELLSTGAFSPLDRFMGQEDYRRVLEEMRLVSGHLFPIPVTLPVEPGAPLHLDQEYALRSPRNELLGIMTIEEIYEWVLDDLAQKVLGSVDLRHPLVPEICRWGKFNISGRLQTLSSPRPYGPTELRLTPRGMRLKLQDYDQKIFALLSRNHSCQENREVLDLLIRETKGLLLVQLLTGMFNPGNLAHFRWVRAYESLAARYRDSNQATISMLPLASRLAGPREALWHALVQRNYGANHLILWEEYFSPGLSSQGTPFYGPLEAIEMLDHYSDELGVKGINLAYLTAGFPSSLAKPCPRLPNGRLAEILAPLPPAPRRQGLCIWFTGLSCSGKSTTAEAVTLLLMEYGREVTLLDGDVVRTHLSKGLGFSKKDRDINIRRIGFVASEIVRHGGTVICAVVSPYQVTREEVRNLIGADLFIEVFVDTPLTVCESRDTKGLYAKARRGEITGFTGIDDPYESPVNPEIRLDTVSCSPEENAHLIIDYLKRRGLIPEGIKHHYLDQDMDFIKPPICCEK